MKKLLAVLALLFVAFPAQADYQIKDGTGAAKYFKAANSGVSGDAYIPQNQITDGTNNASVTSGGALKVDIGGTTVNTTPLSVKITDGSNAITNETGGGDASNNTQNRVPTSSHIMLYNGGTWDMARSGLTGAQTSKTGIQNSIPMQQYNTSAPAPANGNVLPFQSDSAGNLKVTSPVAAAFHSSQLSVGTSAVNFSSAVATNGVTVKAAAANTNTVYVGVSGVTTSTGFPLYAGDSVFIPVSNANLIYCIGGATGQFVGELDN